MQWHQMMLAQVLSDELHGRLGDLLWNMGGWEGASDQAFARLAVRGRFWDSR